MDVGEFRHWHAEGYKETGKNVTLQTGGFEAVPAVCKDYSFFPHRK